MLILIDGIADWEHISTLPAGDELRSYYLAPLPRRALLVCRDGLRLGDLAGLVVDASIGWDRGDVGFARVPGQRQTKVTIYRVARGFSQERLSQILRRAPSD